MLSLFPIRNSRWLSTVNPMVLVFIQIFVCGGCIFNFVFFFKYILDISYWNLKFFKYFLLARAFYFLFFVFFTCRPRKYFWLIYFKTHQHNSGLFSSHLFYSVKFEPHGSSCARLFLLNKHHLASVKFQMVNILFLEMLVKIDLL